MPLTQHPVSRWSFRSEDSLLSIATIGGRLSVGSLTAVQSWRSVMSYRSRRSVRPL